MNGLFRALLYAYPAAFREEYGKQMQLAFEDQLKNANGRTLRVWMGAARDVFTVAPREHWHVILQDLRYTFRAMAANIGFTAVAILSLALGIGANTAIFGVWNQVLHASIPGVRDPQGLVILTNPAETGAWSGTLEKERPYASYDEFKMFRERADAFAELMAAQSYPATWAILTDGGDPELVRGSLVSYNYFSFLGVRPILGRGFEDPTERAPDAVISYSFWQRRFGGRPDVLGKTLSMNSAALTVVGVAPRGFGGEMVARQTDVWALIGMQPAISPGRNWLEAPPQPRRNMWLHLFGRLKPGMTMAQAEAQANTILKADLMESVAGVNSPDSRRQALSQYLKFHPGDGGISSARNDLGGSLTALLIAVAVLLLIACANLANLLLARGATRRGEMAVRLSLGASRGRLLRQLFTESLTLASIGGAAGLALSYFLHQVLVWMLAQSDDTFTMDFVANPAVLGFTAGITFLAAMLFTALPAWQSTRGDAADALRDRSRSATDSAGRVRWGKMLVALQVALTMPLLVIAGLFVKTFDNLQHVDLGFRQEGLVEAMIDVTSLKIPEPRAQAMRDQLREELLRIPGVTGVTYSHNGLYTGSQTNLEIAPEGYVAKPGEDTSAGLDFVGPHFFSTVEVPLLLGREISESDLAAAKPVTVISEALAKKYFPDRNPIGLHLVSLRDNDRLVHEIVGVVKDFRWNSLRGEMRPRYYMSAAQPLPGQNLRSDFLIRVNGDAWPVLAAIRGAVKRVNTSLPLVESKSVTDYIAPRMAADRAMAQLALAFGGVSLVMSAIGLLGVLSYNVARRRGELAIRIALGASKGRMASLVLRETAIVILAGISVGAGLALAASRLVVNRLYGVKPGDPFTLAAALGVLLATAFVAAYLPARRATQLDPMAALREE